MDKIDDVEYGKYQDYLISRAEIRGQYKTLRLFLAFIVTFSGWSALQSTLAQKISAVTQEAFAITSKNHEKDANIASIRLERLEKMDVDQMILAEKVKNLEEKDKEKEKRIKKVERICNFE